MSEFLDVLQQLFQQLGAALMELWLGLPDSVRCWLTVGAVVLVVWALGAIAKYCLTFRFRDSLALQFIAGFKAHDVSDGTDDKGHRRSHRPSPAEALAQLKKCLHVWRVKGGYLTVITYQANQGMQDSEILDRARAATKDSDYTHAVSRFGRSVLLHSRVGA